VTRNIDESVRAIQIEVEVHPTKEYRGDVCMRFAAYTAELFQAFLFQLEKNLI
jgi:hypothetical protein